MYERKHKEALAEQVLIRAPTVPVRHYARNLRGTVDHDETVEINNNNNVVTDRPFQAPQVPGDEPCAMVVTIRDDLAEACLWMRISVGMAAAAAIPTEYPHPYNRLQQDHLVLSRPLRTAHHQAPAVPGKDDL